MVLMLAMASILLAAAAAPPIAGEVKLPLRDYLTLVESVEAADTARAKASSRAEPSVAELVSQQVAIRVDDATAEVVSRFEVELRGRVSGTVALPLTGVASRITVEPPGAAAVTRGVGGLSLIATSPGRYRIQVWGTAPLARSEGVERLLLAPLSAAVAEVEMSLPADRSWRCPDAVVAEDAVSAGRRALRLALPRSKAAVFELRRDVKPAESPKAVSSAVVVTIVSLGRDTVRRHDLVLYEVQHGDLATMTVTLPSSLEPEQVVTDEGTATPWLEGRALRVERQKKLSGLGYLAIVSQPVSREEVALEPVTLDAKVRARYVAYASDIAASVAPEPAASWVQVDISDLPQPVHQAAEALGLVAAWRLRRADAPGQLRATALPGPRMLAGVVKERRTTTLLTVEGTLVHGEQITVEGEGQAFAMALPQGGTLWSAQVNDVPVRPMEQAGGLLIPLGLASSTAASVIDVVIVQERSVPPGRSTLDLTLAKVATPVLRHDWRLLLPERNRYRFERGDLRPVRTHAPEREAREPEARARERLERAHVGKAVMQGPGGTGRVIGRVTDPTGAVVQGATIYLTERRSNNALRLQTDADGEFEFRALPASGYTLEAELAGFKSKFFSNVRVTAGATLAYPIQLEIGALTESVAIEAEPLSRLPPRPGSREALAEESQAEAAEAFRDEVDELRQGLVGGVKPVPVKIPETGKVLTLSGALPPEQVTVTLAVKSPKD